MRVRARVYAFMFVYVCICAHEFLSFLEAHSNGERTVKCSFADKTADIADNGYVLVIPSLYSTST